jgi:flagellar biogenesis protein FliO
VRAACVVLALAFVAGPLAAQAKSTKSGTAASASGTTASGTGTSVPQVDESTTLLGQVPTTNGTTTQPAAGAVSIWDFLRMALILVVVIVAIYLLFWLLRRGAGKRVAENDLIHVLGSKSLATNRAIHLVEVGSSIYLVGSSDGGVELIAEITEKESLDSVRLQAAQQPPATRRTFQQILSEIFRPAKAPFSVGQGLGVLKGQRDRLKKL